MRQYFLPFKIDFFFFLGNVDIIIFQTYDNKFYDNCTLLTKQEKISLLKKQNKTSIDIYIYIYIYIYINMYTLKMRLLG